MTQRLVEAQNKDKKGQLNIPKCKEYVEQCWDAVEKFVTGISDGSISASKWTKAAVEFYQKDLKRKDLEYKVDKVEKVFRFFYFLHLEKDKPFDLIPYQAFTIAALFGFYRKKDGKRRYRTAFLYMSRKNGKTSFVSALQLYFMFDGDPVPRSLLVARNQDQAGLASDYAAQMLKQSPALDKRLMAQGARVHRSKIIFRDPNKFGTIRTLPSNSDALQGYNPSAAILDEIHTYPDQSFYTSIKKGMKARKNPMLFMISTAGTKKDESFCMNMVNHGKSVMEGKSKDDRTFFLLFTMDDGDDISDPKNWYKSNPALDYFLELEDMVDTWNEVKSRPILRNDFLTFDLNVFTNENLEWIPESDLLPVFKDININDFEGKSCMAGIDLSATRDMTSVVLVFYDEETEHYTAFPYFFMPDNPEKKLRPNNINVDEWIREGYVTACEKKTIDYELIYDTIRQLSEKFNIQIVYYDQWNSALLIPKLQEIIAVLESFPQTALRFNEPLKHLEKLIFDHKITLANNPVLKWNFNNVVLWQDGNSNIKIQKNKSKDAVDGAVSLAMAIGGWLRFITNRE